MSENTKIEWCDHTFNPWVGCTKISPACDHCYAESWAKRSGQVLWSGERKRTSIANWRLPVKWDKRGALMQSAWAQGVALHGGDESACIAAGFIKPVRPKVFCASLADVFDNQADPQWRADLLQLIDDTPNLDWLLLTKRISNANAMLDHAEMIVCNRDWTNYLPRPNIWIGATICNQTEADRDIPKLLAVPAHKRFLSMEPLLGAVDLSGNLPAERALRWYRPMLPMLDWVIVCGESGPNARPMHPDWARSLRDQCEAAGVPFMFKQWGQFRPTTADYVVDDRQNTSLIKRFDDGQKMAKVGKKDAGRLLEGREWNGVPV